MSNTVLLPWLSALMLKGLLCPLSVSSSVTLINLIYNSNSLHTKMINYVREYWNVASFPANLEKNDVCTAWGGDMDSLPSWPCAVTCKGTTRWRGMQAGNSVDLWIRIVHINIIHRIHSWGESARLGFSVFLNGLSVFHSIKCRISHRCQ